MLHTERVNYQIFHFMVLNITFIIFTFL